MIIQKSLSMTFSIFALVLFAAGSVSAQATETTGQVNTLIQEIKDSVSIAKQMGRTCYLHGQTRANLQTRLDSLRKIRQLRRAQAVEAHEIETQIAHFDQVCDLNLR